MCHLLRFIIFLTFLVRSLANEASGTEGKNVCFSEFQTYQSTSTRHPSHNGDRSILYISPDRSSHLEVGCLNIEFVWHDKFSSHLKKVCLNYENVIELCTTNDDFSESLRTGPYQNKQQIDGATCWDVGNLVTFNKKDKEKEKSRVFTTENKRRQIWFFRYKTGMSPLCFPETIKFHGQLKFFTPGSSSLIIIIIIVSVGLLILALAIFMFCFFSNYFKNRNTAKMNELPDEPPEELPEDADLYAGQGPLDILPPYSLIETHVMALKGSSNGDVDLSQFSPSVARRPASPTITDLRSQLKDTALGPKPLPDLPADATNRSYVSVSFSPSYTSSRGPSINENAISPLSPKQGMMDASNRTPRPDSAPGPSRDGWERAIHMSAEPNSSGAVNVMIGNEGTLHNYTVLGADGFGKHSQHYGTSESMPFSRGSSGLRYRNSRGSSPMSMERPLPPVPQDGSNTLFSEELSAQRFDREVAYFNDANSSAYKAAFDKVSASPTASSYTSPTRYVYGGDGVLRRESTNNFLFAHASPPSGTRHTYSNPTLLPGISPQGRRAFGEGQLRQKMGGSTEALIPDFDEI